MKRLSLLLLVSCATGTGEKGGLVAHPEVSGERLAAVSGKRLALLVGVNTAADESWPPLRYAASDALEFAQVLVDPGGGRFEAETLTTPATTTKLSLLQALDRLKQRNTSPNDVVVVYFSGHGTLDRNAKGEYERYLVAEDTRRDQVRATGLSVEELRERFEQLPSRRKALILASCHSGTGKSVLPPDIEKELEGTKGPPPKPLDQVSKAVMTLSAAARGQAAREDERLQHDIYTHFLLEALRGRKDRNHDGAVSAEEAHDYARTRTYYFTGGKQTPTAEATVVGIDPVVLVGDISALGMPELGSYDDAWEGAEVKVDGSKALSLPGAATVAKGKHHVQVLKGDTQLADGTVTLDDGDYLDLKKLEHHDSGISVSGGVGAHLFLTPELQNQVGGPMPVASLAVRWPSPFSRRLRFIAELQGGTAGTHISPDGFSVPVTLNLFEGGAGAQWALELGRFTFTTGPHLSFAYFSRSYTLAGTAGTDTAFLTVPGWTAEGHYPIWGQIEVLASLRVTYAMLSIDGKNTNLGALVGWLGLGWRFEE